MAQGCSLRSSNPSWGIHLFDLSSKGSQSIVPFFLEKITSFWNRLFITFNDDLSIFRQIYANSKQCDYGWIKLTQYYLFGKKKSNKTLEWTVSCPLATSGWGQHIIYWFQNIKLIVTKIVQPKKCPTVESGASNKARKVKRFIRKLTSHVLYITQCYVV